MKLTSKERSAILAGDHKALKRDKQPNVKTGDNLVLSWTRGGRQIVDRATGETVAIPRKPTVWIEFKQPSLKDGVWVIQFSAYDHREPTRLLSAAPSPPREVGLKTRWRKPPEVPKRGSQTVSWTPESERGYGGGGKAAIDGLEGVNDAALDDYSRRVEEENVLRRNRDRAKGQRLAEEMRLAREYRKGTKPQALSAIRRRIERADRRFAA